METDRPPRVDATLPVIENRGNIGATNEWLWTQSIGGQPVSHRMLRRVRREFANSRDSPYTFVTFTGRQNSCDVRSAEMCFVPLQD
jgi:hypothetical protein